jgi:hypothetical protein
LGAPRANLLVNGDRDWEFRRMPCGREKFRATSSARVAGMRLPCLMAVRRCGETSGQNR